MAVRKGRGTIGAHRLSEDKLEEVRRERISMERVKDLPSETIVVNFGPQHPATHGTLQMVMELDGERVVRITPHLGYLHTGFEKLGEARNYNHFVALSDRMNYLSPLSNNIGYVLAVEKLIDLEVPLRVTTIRTILAELSRMADHFLCIGTAALDLGAFTAFLYGFRAREILYDLFEQVTGTRLTTSYMRVGGLPWDVPKTFVQEVKAVTKLSLEALDDVRTLLDKNRIWLDRTKNIGVISQEDAVAWGLTGPVLRSTGLAWDIRRVEPYLLYEQLDFEIPVGANGDVFDRYWVRCEEIKQSVRIIHQVLEGLPEGPIKADDPKIILPAKQQTYTKMEEMIHHFKLTMEFHGINPPRGEVYMATEAPNGELGFYIVSDGSGKPYRVRVRPPSFVHYQVFPKMMEGAILADTVAVLGSLNVIAGESDR